MAEAQERGEISSREKSIEVAERLWGLIDGYSLHALLEPQRMTRTRLRKLIEQELERMTTPMEV